MKKYFVILVIVLFAWLLAEDADCYNNVIQGQIATLLAGNDEVKITVSDVGGRIKYLRLKTFYYPSYDNDPMYQSIENFGFTYNPSITSTGDHTDADGNQYRYSFWGNPNNNSPQIGVGDYVLTNTFDGYFYVDLNGLRDSSTYPISVALPPDVQRYLQVCRDRACLCPNGFVGAIHELPLRREQRTATRAVPTRVLRSAPRQRRGAASCLWRDALPAKGTEG